MIRIFLLLLAVITPVIHASAEIREVKITQRTPVLNGKSWGKAGPYEYLRGEVVVAIDPSNPVNSRIVDLELAPRAGDGMVYARTRLEVLRPLTSPGDGGCALVEVSNRGGKFSLRYFNRATGGAQLDPGNPEAFGDGLLMRRGLTVIWIGWEFDVPDDEGLLRLETPVAVYPGGKPVMGWVRSDWTVDETVNTLSLGHRTQTGYPVADTADSMNVLTVRSGREGQRIIVPRGDWGFGKMDGERIIPSNDHIFMKTGFQAGYIYELVYRSINPPVVGIGLATIRDIISYAKYDPACEFPVKSGIAAGVSQTGRFLRHFLYQGFNTDERGRQACDGMMIITAGAGRGSFNHRFAQPSRDAHRYSAFFYPTDLFPFTSRDQYDPVTGFEDGLLSHLVVPQHAPRIFYINTGYEYWGRAASLIHTSIDGKNDLFPYNFERIYHIASAQHFAGTYPGIPVDDSDPVPVYRGHPMEFRVNYRALLVRMHEWVVWGKNPPESSYPRISDHTLLPLNELCFPGIPGMKFPTVHHEAYRMDYGERWQMGIIDREPPLPGMPYPVLVPRVDTIGNELGGIRNLELEVPLATYFPWNLRLGMPGPQDELTDFLGTYVPLPRNPGEKIRSGDPRPDIVSLYTNREGYRIKVDRALKKLVKEGFLLGEDTVYMATHAMKLWDSLMEKHE